jgi:PAS domain S-box-containing protein
VRLRSLLNLATTPMVVADHNRRFVDCNPMASELLGASREAILCRRVDDFTADEGGFDVERFWSRLMEEGRLNGSYPCKRLNGRLRPVVYAATANLVPGLHMAIFAKGTNGSSDDPPLPHRRGSPLTPRELEILQMIASGLTDREIASRLVLSQATARTHARNLIGKLGAHTRAQAVALAIRRGEITP